MSDDADVIVCPEEEDAVDADEEPDEEEDGDEDETLVCDIDRINRALGIERPWASGRAYRRPDHDDDYCVETSDSDESNDESDVSEYANATGFLDVDHDERRRVALEERNAGRTSGILATGEASTIAAYDLSQDIREMEAAQSEPSLENCLYLNRSYQEAIISVIDDLEVLLMNIKDKQIVTQEELNSILSEGKVSSGYLLSLRNMRIPYFRRLNGMFPPMNDDTRLKVENQELSLPMRLRRKWATHEFAMLEKAVAGNALELEIQPIIARKEILLEKLGNQDLPAADLNAIRDECKEKDDHLREIKSQKPSSLISGSRDRDYDWMKISAIDFDALRTPRECELYWKNYVHPSISKKKWTKEELAKLKDLVDTTFGLNNWDLVAEELQTDRIAVQCAEKYFLTKNYRVGVWTKSEKLAVINAVEVCRIGDYIPFHLVSNMIEGRPLREIWRQWTYYLDPSIHHGKWTFEEDTMLLTAVWLLGAKNWFQIKNFVRTRSDVQCCERWHSTLDPSLRFKEFSRTDDNMLIDLVKIYGKKWSLIGKRLHRPNNRVADRYKRLMRFRESNPDPMLTLGTIRRKDVEDYRSRVFSNVAGRLTEISEEIGSSLSRRRLRMNFRAITEDTRNTSAGEIKLGEHLRKCRIENLVTTMMQKPGPTVRKISTVERGFREFFKLSAKRRHRGRPPKLLAIEDGDEVYEDTVVKFKDLLFNGTETSSGGSNKISILPPMTTTMQAFRNILLMRTRLGCAGEAAVGLSCLKDRGAVEETGTSSQATNEAGVTYDDLFRQFASLFAWPALLSAIRPCDEPQKPCTKRRRRGRKRRFGEVEDTEFICFAKPTGESYTAAAKAKRIAEESKAKPKKGRPRKTAPPKPATEPTRRSTRNRNTDA